MAPNVTQQDIDILMQSEKICYSKIEILNPAFKVIDSIEGLLISDSFTNDANEPVRRTYSATLLSSVQKGSGLVNLKPDFWADKYVRPYTGVKNSRTGEIQWYLKGTFLTSNLNFSYDQTTDTLTLSCQDMMCLLNGERDGQCRGFTIKIPAGSDIRKVILSLITEEKGLTRFRVDPIGAAIPYDLEFGTGSTVCDILSEIQNLYAGWEFFFDLEGNFIWQRIPNCDYEDNILTDDIIRPLCIKESRSIPIDFKNVTEVWGKCLEPDRFAKSCSLDQNIYTASFELMEELGSSLTYAMTVPETNDAHPKVHIIGTKDSALHDLGIYDIIVTEIPDEEQRKRKTEKFNYQIEVLNGRLSITQDKGEQDKILKEIAQIRQKIKDLSEKQTEYLPANAFTKDTTYVLQYKDKKMYYLGQFQVHAVFKNEYPDCPFSVQNIGREIWDIKSDGDYSKIYSEELAMQRAKYENEKTTVVKDSITLDLIDIPWLEVNKKISYTPKSSEEKKEYLIKSIQSSSSEGTMSISLVRFYEDRAVSV